MTKLNKETARAKFRNSVNVKEVFSVEDQNPDYDYKYVDLNFIEGSKRAERYMDNNWEVVYSKEKPKDDRASAAHQDGKDTDLRTSPVTITTKGGHTQVLMRIKKTDRQANALANAAKDKAHYEASTKRKIVQKGTSVTVQDEVDLNKKSDE